MPNPDTQATTVFVSYSHHDKKWLKRLQVHIKPLVREGNIDLWDDTRIPPGADWKVEIDRALAKARVAVFLVSPDFLASDFIHDEELPVLLEAAEKRGTRILSVILSHCLYADSKLGRYQAINSPDKPLEGLSKAGRDKAISDLARAIAAGLSADAPAKAPFEPPRGPTPSPLPTSKEKKVDGVRNNAPSLSPPGSSSGQHHAEHQSLGTWVFGGLLLLFLFGVFAFAPTTLPDYKHRILAVLTALFAGLFGWFLSGEIGIRIGFLKSSFGDVAIRATGSLALFVVVLVWWLGPLAPVTASKDSKNITVVERSATMEDAVAYADRAISAYMRGMGDQSNGLSNPSRSLVYAEGIGAMNCAKQAMLPWHVSDAWMTEFFSTALAELSTRDGTLATQLDELRALSSVLEVLTTANDPQVKGAKALAESVTRLLVDTAVTRQNGFVLKRRLALAGQTLVFAVDRIAGEVNKALLSTVPSLTALPGIIANLSPAADMFRQAPPTAAAEIQEKADKTVRIGAQSLTRDKKGETNVARAELTKKAQEVRSTVIRLAIAEGTVRAAVEKFEQPIPAAVLKQCGVAENDIIKPLRILPDNKVTMTAGETTTVFLTGGSGQYAASATGKVQGLTVSQPVPLGEAVRIATTTATPATETTVLVKDVAGQTAIIGLTITAPK